MTEPRFSFTNFGWPSAAGSISSSIVEEVRKAAWGGGSLIRELFAEDLSALRHLRQAGAGGDVTWLSAVDNKTGLPTRYVVSGDTFLTLGMVPTETAREVLSGGAELPTPLAYIYLTLSTGPTQRVTQLLSGIASYQGDKLTGFASEDGLKDLVSGLVNTAVTFVQAIFELAWEAPIAADVGAAAITAGQGAQDAAEGASGATKIVGPGGFEVETEILMTSGEALSLGLGAVALIALFPLEALSKKMTDQVRVYNATGDKLAVSLAWLNPGASYAGPLAIDPIELSPVGPVWTPPWVIGDDAVSYVNWIFNNTDTLDRIAYVIRISSGGALPPALVAVDIPNHNDNSAKIGFTPSDDFRGFWEANHGKNTGLVATEQSPTGGYRISLATNQVNGESPAPVDGAVGYNYEHVILVERAT